MFSQTVEYALRVVVYLAGLEGTPATTKQIAAVTKVPEGYLAKVLQGLGRAGLVRSQRGLHGGSILALPPDRISLYDVIEAIQPVQRIRYCPLGVKSHGTNLCALHQRLDDAMATVEHAFRDAKIADLLAETRASKPLCESPTEGNGHPLVAGSQKEEGKGKSRLTALSPLFPLSPDRLPSRSPPTPTEPRD